MSRPAREFVGAFLRGAIGFGLPVLFLVGIVCLVFVANVAAALFFTRP